MGGSIRGKEQMEILAGGLGVAQLELNSLPLLNHVSHRHRAGRLIRPHQVPDKKIPPFEPVTMFVHDNPQMQRAVRPPPIVAA